MIPVFIGYDSRIPVAFQTCVHSIITRSSEPVSVCPITLSSLHSDFNREMSPLQSTEFSFSRFLTPFLSNYVGWSLFMDNDIIVKEDIAKLWALRSEEHAVMCVKHNYTPPESTKFMGARDSAYEKKNWSSVMLFNNAKCKALTPNYVNTATGLELHRFQWLESEELIGSLPPTWNHLVGHNEASKDSPPSLLHYTRGGPFYPDYSQTAHAKEWFDEFCASNHCEEADIFSLAKLAKGYRE